MKTTVGEVQVILRMEHLKRLAVTYARDELHVEANVVTEMGDGDGFEGFLLTYSPPTEQPASETWWQRFRARRAAKRACERAACVAIIGSNDSWGATG